MAPRNVTGSNDVFTAVATAIQLASNDAPLQCTLLPGGFGVLVQGLLVVVSVGTLVIKKMRESPANARTWSTFMLDSSKQFVGAGWAHVLNLFCAGMQGAELAGDSCSWYWINIMFDTTLGTFVEYVLLNTISFKLEANNIGQPDDFLTGEYLNRKGQFEPRMYVAQLTVWIGCVTGMKFIMLLVTTLFSDQCLRIANGALAIVSWSPELKLVAVMVVTPCIMNAVQCWVTDSFIKKGGVPFSTCWSDAKQGLRSAVGLSVIKLSQASRRGDSSLQAPLICADVARLQRQVVQQEQTIARERQVAEVKFSEAAEVVKEIADLQHEMKRQTIVVNEDAADREQLRLQVMDLEAQLASRNDELAVLLNQVHTPATSARAVAVEYSNAKSVSHPAFLGVYDHNDDINAVVAAEAALRHVDQGDVNKENCQAIMSWTSDRLAKCTPDQVRYAAAQRSALLDEKLGTTEAKIREIGWRTSAIVGEH